jgi:hypothetical protein
LVPGYIEHNILSTTQSTWAFKGDLGFMKKTVKLQMDIKEWNEPSEELTNNLVADLLSKNKA